MEHNNKYLINMFERYTDLKKSNKLEFDSHMACTSLRECNNYLWKIFRIKNILIMKDYII